MNSQPIIGLLGAEKQAAVSAALAPPERRFLFVSDRRVLDGWDLPNVEVRWSSPSHQPHLPADNIHWVPLCARWQVPNVRNPSLQAVMGIVAQQFTDALLPVRLLRPAQGECMVKGNAWHRPDAPIWGEISSLAEVNDPYGCGIAYQEYWPAQRHYLATGRRLARGAVELAVVAVHSESCARDDVLAAGETVRHDRIAELTLAMLDYLDHSGFFTCNWLERNGEVRLTSARPVPRAVPFRRAGWDSFTPALSGTHIAPPGLKFAVDIHYSSYQPLAA